MGYNDSMYKGAPCDILSTIGYQASNSRNFVELVWKIKFMWKVIITILIIAGGIGIFWAWVKAAAKPDSDDDYDSRGPDGDDLGGY
ncbi:hypothetical protein KJ885_01680 [Patescibacteria group bacterium]|nr:hypothetical protein [Patescibacteria group bacterium]